MASKFKVDELRAQLAQRGLSTTGVRPTLVRRLEAALRKENNHSENTVDDDVSGSTSKKRERVNEDEDLDLDRQQQQKKKKKTIDEFRRMTVTGLRKEASKLGLSSKGTCSELLDRICDDLPNLKSEAKEDVQAKEEEDVIDKAKIVTATRKGAAVLDQWLPDHLKAQYHVMQLDDGVYDAMLNQTNVGDNNNKFYVIQLLESDDGGKYMVYYRWGRVGVKGQDKLIGPYTSRDSALNEFKMKFFAKTKNHWADRDNFVCHPKSYVWLEMDYNGKEDESEKEHGNSVVGVQPKETQLEARVAKFISLICNISLMRQQMVEIGYNADKLPLGKLSKSTILKGYEVLKNIADVISKADRKRLEQLSGEFYTVIPHDFGFKKMREFVIDTPQKLKSKLEMVEALGEIEVAAKLLKDSIEMQDPLYSHYQKLHCEFLPLEVDSEEFSMIADYTKNTHARTHSNYSVDIVQVFSISREGEAERFSKFSGTKNRMLLWHGSRLTNWTGILSQGLRIAPPEAPVTGYMFGKGVYFADMFSKSANYCYASSAITSGVLLLCEVALGDVVELLQAKHDADKLPEGKLSTKGVGSAAPDLSQAKTLKDGVIIPLGKPKAEKNPKGALLYNEYIVYNVEQIRMRYLVQVNFKFR